ncbi:hypothetical protein D3C85_1123940 [compost metagenome]
MLITRQHVDIQRRLTLLVGFFDARSQVHLQRMVVQNHFLRVGDQCSKAKKFTEWIVLCQLAQTFGTAVIEIFESGEQKRRNSFRRAFLARTQLILRDYANTHSDDFSCFWRTSRYQRG